MTTLIAHLAAFFAHPLWERIVWTLLHSLWQGALIAVIVALILRRLPALRADARHAVTLAGFAALALALPITFAALTGWNAWTTQHHAAPSTLAQSAPLPPADSSMSPAPGASMPAPPSVAHSPPAPVPSTAAHSGSPNSVAETPQASETFRGWVAWIALLWLLGTTLMLIRTASSLIATRALLRTPALPDHHPLTDTLRTLAARMRLTGPIRLAESDRIATPCVAGLLRPVILLPITALTNLDESQLRAILAHELAHIRRKDLLVALLQRIIESILFFNPGALWLGRQLRVEREACCDALAAEAIDDPHAVARTLAHVAAASRAPAPFPAAALAMTGPDDAPLLQRIRRLLLPNERIPARLPWPSFLAVTLIACASLFTLTITAAQVGETAAKLLKPEERIEQVRKIAGEFSDRVVDAEAPENLVTISGRVRLADGSPLTIDLKIGGTVKFRTSPYGSTTKSIAADFTPDGSFKFESPHGEISIWAYGPGFAPAGVENLRPEPGKIIDNIELVLHRGYEAQLRILDAEGTPLSDVAVEKQQVMGSTRLAKVDATTGSDGLVTFDHLASTPVRLSVHHPGFVAETIEVTLDENQPYTWRLTPTEPLVVTLLDRSKPIPTGFAPLANAEILHAFDTASVLINEPRGSRRPEGALATTDEHGRFSIDSLQPNAHYVFWVRWGENYQLLPMLTLADSPAEIIVDPPLWITVEIRGDLSRLTQRNGRPIVTFSDSWRFSHALLHSHGAGHTFAATLDPETRTARIGPLVAKQQFTINAGAISRTIDPRRIDPSQPIIIDIDIEQIVTPGREVVFKLVPPDGWPAPEGRIRVHPVDPVSHVGMPHEIDVVNGRASVIVPFTTEDSGGKVSLSEPLSLPGYTFQRQHSIEVPPGDGPLVVPVPVQLAGSVFGRVTMPDGSPAGRIHTSIYTVERDSAFINSQSETTSDGRFVVNAIPLHRTVRLGVSNASGGEHRVMSEEFRFTEDNLTREINLQFVEGQTVSARILDPDGNPARGVIANLNYSSPFRSSHQGTPRTPDVDGRIVWNDVNLDLPGEHIIQVQPTSHTIGLRHKIDPNDPNPSFQLVRGVHTSGQIIDADTGEPIPNLRFTLGPDFNNPKQQYPAHFSIITDKHGRFELHNLEPHTYFWYAPDTTTISLTYTDSNAETTTVEPRYGMLPLQPGILDQTITVRLHDRARSSRPPAAN